MRRYVSANGRTDADAPITSTITGARSTPAIVSTIPSPAASQSPSMPCSAAARWFPAPSWRATAPVVE